MRRLPALLLTLVAVVALAACSSGGAPGWTYAPAASATPLPSGGASGEPSAGASAAPSSAASAPAAGSPAPSASAAASASASASGGAGELTIKAPEGAATTGFDPTTLETAAGTAFTLTFENEDSQAQHNLVLQNPDGTAVTVEGDTAPFQGPGDRSYQVPALTAGAYKYVCQIHPSSMIGTLTVQ
jgi:plastocyanin